MIMSGSILFIAGLAALLIGAEMVVRGSAKLGALLGVRPLVLGLTVVAIGTSLPELAIGIDASLQGSSSLAVGNIAGTNICNLLLILGLSALLQPLPLHLQVLKLDLPMMVAATAIMAAMAWDGALTRLDGFLLFGLAIIYTIGVLRISKRESQAVRKEFEDMCDFYAPTIRQSKMQRRWKYAVMLAAGIGTTIIGADLMVTGAIEIARTLGISEAIIGLTIVAVGTSSPELAIAIISTIRNDRDVAVGNVLGSSIYNILVVLGIICMVSPDGLLVGHELQLFDIPLMMGVALACVPVFIRGRCISRTEGGLGVAVYMIYLLWIILYRA